MQNKIRKTVLLFDFDGTIADTVVIIPVILKSLAQEYKRPEFAYINIEKMRDKNFRDLIRYFKIPFYKLPFLILSAQKEFNRRLSEVRTVPGMKVVLKKLYNRNFPLGIVSSNLPENINPFLKKEGIASFFEFIHTERNIFGKAKVITRIIKRYKLDPEKTFYIGDEVRDIEAAKKSKVKSIGVTWGFNSQKLLAQYNPEFIAEAPEELLKIITF